MLRLRMDRNLTYSQIGRLFGVSRQRIYQILGPDLGKIRFKKNHPKLINRIIFERDNFTCQKCGATRSVSPGLKVHHIDENRRNNALTNLITLCSECHSHLHYKKSG